MGVGGWVRHHGSLMGVGDWVGHHGSLMEVGGWVRHHRSLMVVGAGYDIMGHGLRWEWVELGKTDITGLLIVVGGLGQTSLV